MTIPNSVTSIGSFAFGSCSSLVSITLPFIGSSANTTTASESTLFGYIFGTNSYTGGQRAEQYYESSSYKIYYIPASLTMVTITGGNILYGAFYNCTKLTSVTIGDSVTSIGDYAFRNCTKLTSVTIGNSVTSIGSHAFIYCTSLTSVYYSGTASQWANISFDTANYTANPLCYAGNLYLNGTLATDITLENITTINAYAFYNCRSLTRITISDSVTSIGSYAFDNCFKLVEVHNLSSLTVTAGSTDNGDVAYYAKNVYTATSGSSYLTTQDGFIFYNDSGTYYLMGYTGSDTVLTLPTLTINGETISYSIYKYAFYNNTKITSITIPDSVTSIGSYAFCYCTTAIIWGDSPTITEIGSYVFAYYMGTSITIPNSVTSIGEYAFENCTALTEINFNATAMDDLSSYNHVFTKAGQSGDGITVTIGANVTKIPAYLFNPTSSSTYSPYIISVVFENGSVCGSIGSYAFYACTTLESITIPDSVTSIGGYVFGYCNSLTNVSIGDSVTSIGKYAFESCTSLESVTIGDGVTSIGDDAFYYCTKLTSVYYSGTASEWSAISIGLTNTSLTSATRYYYSESKPDYTDGYNYWHYVEGVITVWVQSTEE